MGKFHDAVVGWATEQQESLLQTTKDAITLLVDDMTTPVSAGGNMPVDTGYLRASLDASYTEPPMPSPKFSGGPPMIGLRMRVDALIAGLKVGQTIHFGFRASYAALQNYGWKNFSGHYFLEISLQRWPDFVQQAAQKRRKE